MLNRSIGEFKAMSRLLAEDAQDRENLTTQPKESIVGDKVSITMRNLLGGLYFMTADEGVRINDRFFLIEKKHSSSGELPSVDVIRQYRRIKLKR